MDEPSSLPALSESSPSTVVRARVDEPHVSTLVRSSSAHANEQASDAAPVSAPPVARPAAKVAPLAGKLGKYQLVASLGRGGMAEVMLALVKGPAGFNKLTVLKILREDVRAASHDAVQLFVAEAQLGARLNHRNVVRTYEAAEIDGRYMLAMEYLEGQTYRHVQRRAAKTCGLLLHEHLRILSQVARGLHYVHLLTDYDGEPLATVHRDVSPQNVFVTYDGEVKLLDFGIAQTRSSELSAQDRVIKGKLDYMAPEQLKREPVDARADVFALGAMLWEAISGARFAGGRAVSDYAKAQARVYGSEPNIRDVQPNVPDALAALVDQALTLSPADRLPDASSFADAIDAYLLAVGESCPLPRGHEPRGAESDSLPALMNSLFARDRAKLRALVDSHLQRVQSEQHQPAEGSSERVLVAAVPEVETSGWTSIRDLSGQSGLHSLSGAGADEPTASIVIDPVELAAVPPAAAEPASAPELFDADEPTRPRIAADLSSLARQSHRATLPPAISREPERAFSPRARPSLLRGATHRPSLARGTGNYERAHVRARATTALLLTLGALSGGALAWFAPSASVDPADPNTAVVLPESPASGSPARDELTVDLPPPLAEPAGAHESTASLGEAPVVEPQAELVVTEPVVTEIVEAVPSPAPAASSAATVEPRGLASATEGSLPADDTAGAPVPLDPPQLASKAGSGEVQPVASAPTAAPPKASLAGQEQGTAPKPAVSAKKLLLRPAGVGAAVRAPAPAAFKPTVERNPYLR